MERRDACHIAASGLAGPSGPILKITVRFKMRPWRRPWYIVGLGLSYVSSSSTTFIHSVLYTTTLESEERLITFSPKYYRGLRWFVFIISLHCVSYTLLIISSVVLHYLQVPLHNKSYTKRLSSRTNCKMHIIPLTINFTLFIYSYHFIHYLPYIIYKILHNVLSYFSLYSQTRIPTLINITSTRLQSANKGIFRI